MKVAKTVSELNRTADQWELFDGSGAEACAKRLNSKFTELVNAGRDRDEVEAAMLLYMQMPQNAEHGAADSEPSYQLEVLLRKVFGE